MVKKSKKALPISKKSNPTKGYKSVFGLVKESALILSTNSKTFIKILLIYAIVYIVLVLGFSSPGTVSNISSSHQSGINNELSKLSSSFTSFGLLLNSSSPSSSNPSANVYGFILFIILSLVLIWTIREINQGNKVKVKEAYYNSMTPFIPFVIVLVIMSIQLIPISIAFVLYNYVIVGGIAVGVLEHLIWAIAIVFLAVISFYFLASSVFALLMTAIEGLTPMSSLRKAKQLVKGQRLTLSMKLIFLFLFISIVISLIMILDIITIPAIAPWLLQALLLVAIVFAYLYIFSLYRELNTNGSKKS